MDPISNVDRLVFLLRQRLQERARTETVAKGARKPASRESESPLGLDKLQALAAVDGIDDRQFRRALIQNILTDQLGAKLINEAKFQQVVDRVTETLEDDPNASRLLNRIVGELRAQAR